MYCKNCGKSLTPEAEICIGCGVRPPGGSKFCYSCGTEISPLAEICVKCGVRVKPTEKQAHGKNKVVAVVLSVILGPFTWIYTHKKDWDKLYPAVIINGVSFLTANSHYTGSNMGIFNEALIILAITYVWAIIISAVRRNKWYQDY